jgi:Protein of unknown function (DUF3307)
MTWVELLSAFLICHLVGDFFFQTEAQAVGKSGGLTDRRAARALGAHLATYALAMAPAVVWIASERSVAVAALALVAIVIPHAVQDDRRLLAAYARRIKGTDPDAEPLVMFGLDQTGHAVSLALLALALG